MANLGDRVKDPVTGITGIAFCRVTYLQGCDRIGIQQPIITNKDKEVICPELFHVDEPQLIIVKKNAIIPVKTKTKRKPGGPSGYSIKK